MEERPLMTTHTLDQLLERLRDGTSHREATRLRDRLDAESLRFTEVERSYEEFMSLLAEIAPGIDFEDIEI
jgi:hypothetical protein